ncbi:hypothetical protein QP547_02180 [Weeksella virosa]|uniref:hypothetical protein n=1 Tax=Weeksella virosa TaxID=1014 RepID=UPI000E040872|nr:hypothetical protein [Weeksella virosa]MDK7674620.1 hypothetical protein [Weeksella virosa]SUP54746.1 Uncharacterised protein [Weeksella virosa]
MVKYTFEIFVKEKKNIKLRNILFNLFILGLVSGLSYIFTVEGWLENSFVWIIYILIMATIVAYFNKMFQKEKYEPKGTTMGEIAFYPDKIFLGDTLIPTKNIKHITIKNDDYVGKEVRDFGEFKREEGSFGVHNFLTIQDHNNTFKEVQFKQKTRKEFQNMREILIDYYHQDLLDYDDLLYIMKIEYDLDKIELKKDLER